MRLATGTPAPDFSAPDLFGTPVSLAALRGRPVLLSFYRYASCPLCNLRVRDLTLAQAALKQKGLVMLAVFQSTAESMRHYVGRLDAPFPLIPDPEMALYRLYGVERSVVGLLRPESAINAVRAFGQGFAPGKIEGPIDRLPADFLISADGMVDVAFYAKAAADHLPIEDIERWLAAQPAVDASAASPLAPA